MARGTAAIMLSFFILLQASLTISSVISPRQFKIPQVDYSRVDLLSPVKTETLKPQTRSDATRVRMFYGPFKLLGTKDRLTTPITEYGMRLTHEGMIFDRRLDGMCKNCMVLAGKADLHFLNGTRSTISHGVYNHHLLVLDGNKRSMPWYLCPGQEGLGESPAAGFMITGVAEATNWYSPPESNIKAGYYIGEKQKEFIVNAELVNYRDEAVEVYLTTDVEYVKGWPENHLDASMSLHSVTGCVPPSFMVPKEKGQYNLTSPKTPVLRDGFIVASTG